MYMYMYICICICIYMYICMYIYIYAYIHICICKCIYIYMYMYMYMYMNMYMYMYICVCVCLSYSYLAHMMHDNESVWSWMLSSVALSQWQRLSRPHSAMLGERTNRAARTSSPTSPPSVTPLHKQNHPAPVLCQPSYFHSATIAIYQNMLKTKLVIYIAYRCP